ncbi:prolyl 4-hydroxylase subunit alpha-1 isoform X1 [Drosophila santomea]|uniref:prolyl 4-hydroxylase subunit alpha-1 isoform X1 n=1 Tax=Drosophila santomea TaxID=129105 RepID=UPI001953A16C|nr:prolyl 4-hydroxylase subunit alpha-1 isoform X1 [Drosophila santomea]
MLLDKLHIFLLWLMFWKAEGTLNWEGRKEFLVTESAKMDLMQLDGELIDSLMNYAEKIEQKVSRLKRLAQELRQPLEAAKGREEEYLGNPLHSFPLIRHMYQDWRYLEEFMQKPVGEEEIDFLRRKLLELPWQADTEEAAVSIFRVAETYGMMPWEMANGLIDNVRFNSTMSALDCFEVAKLYFKWGYFKQALQWISISKTRMKEEYSGVYEVLGMTGQDVALLQARCLVELDLIDVAREVLLKQPDLAENATNLLYLFVANPFEAVDSPPKLGEDYKRLCRSSFSPRPSKLLCRYHSTTSLFLVLAPLKMEEISLEPYIVVYHDILPDKDMQQLIALAEPHLRPTEVFEEDKSEARTSDRSAIGTFLPLKDMKPSGKSLLDRLTQRMRDITGLQIRHESPFNIIKYGFGAHYATHFNFFKETNSETEGHGDRMATVLFYLNDAPNGGATVFPRIDVKVPAERGKVLFWHNLNGETHDVEPNTLHAACPVFHGSKWVMAAWIHEYDQMFIQPMYREGKMKP